MKKLTSLLAFVVITFLLPSMVSGQGNVIQVITFADVAGDGSSHTVASIAGSSYPTARWVQFIAAPSNSTTNCGTSAISGCPRFGDSSVSTSRGFFLQPGVGIPLAESSGSQRWRLTDVYFLAQSGDKLTIIIGI